jgi:Leucine-rich repeat (LRR) protein
MVFISQHLWLDLNNLEGTLPDELFMLSSLETLSMSLNPLEGSLPKEVGLLTSLQGLMFLSTWLLSPSTIPSEIGLLTQLRALSLHDNKIQD